MERDPLDKEPERDEDWAGVVAVDVNRAALGWVQAAIVFVRPATPKPLIKEECLATSKNAQSAVAR